MKIPSYVTTLLGFLSAGASGVTPLLPFPWNAVTAATAAALAALLGYTHPGTSKPPTH